MASHSLGLSLHEAARRMGVPFIHENEPVDRFVDANGLRFHYLEWGDPANPTVLMLHGVSQQAHSWDFISLPLSPDYHVLALDQRGHGDSDWAGDSDYSLDAMVGDLDAIVPALGLDGGKFHLMGHSMGGRNSFVWASRHPGALRSLTIVDTGPETATRGRQRIQRFQKLPDNLDTLDEFADRIQEYTGRTREQVLGALKYSIRQGPDGKWTWKYDRVIRERGRQDGLWAPEQLWEVLAEHRLPHAGHPRRPQRRLRRRHHAAHGPRNRRLQDRNHRQRRALGAGRQPAGFPGRGAGHLERAEGLRGLAENDGNSTW